MIRKSSLLSSLSDLAEIEKMLIPILNKHVSSALFLSELDDTQRKQIKEQFQNIVITQTKHVESLNKIESEVEKAGSDVY